MDLLIGLLFLLAGHAVIGLCSGGLAFLAYRRHGTATSAVLGAFAGVFIIPAIIMLVVYSASRPVRYQTMYY
ncbi:hypothetical protein ONR57_22640 [Hoyosella sp. YIM 151337]|uniref:hypothetical protein n=1 Tax=Hoyosella sp. YIM 151337 TaxID=2992742 RepID=UPI00223659E2|nr:hypothetical protein [Hoyosella sp. YIM 151337]MCW4356107.1 hypothetical protein [Hoyosella sp. YIM 151337]